MTIEKLRKDRTTRKGLVKRLDKIVSEIVRLRDKKCVICGSIDKLGCGHLFSRYAYSTRWDLENCYASCWSCNYRHEYDPYPMMNKISELKGIGFVDDLHKRFTHPVILKSYQLQEMLENFKVIKKTMEHD